MQLDLQIADERSFSWIELEKLVRNGFISIAPSRKAHVSCSEQFETVGDLGKRLLGVQHREKLRRVRIVFIASGTAFPVRKDADRIPVA